MWFVRRFGPDVNLGNIAPEDVLVAGDDPARAALGHGGAGGRDDRRDREPSSGVLLARHGETNDNLEPIRVQGFRDTPLNDTGRRQAAELAERVAGDGDRSLWSSDLSRARARRREIVGARIGLEPRLDPRLREANRGDWEGWLFIDIARDEPERYAAWLRAGEDVPVPRRRVAARAAGPRQRRARGHPRAPASCRRWSSATAARSG